MEYYVTLEAFLVGPTDPLAGQAAPYVRAVLELGHRWIAVRAIRDKCRRYPDRVDQILWSDAEADGYTDAVEWLRLHEEAAK